MADAPALSAFRPADAARLGIPPDQVGTYNATFRAHTLTGKVDVQASSEHARLDALLLLLRPRVAERLRQRRDQGRRDAVRRVAAVVHDAGRVDPRAARGQRGARSSSPRAASATSVAANPDAAEHHAERHRQLQRQRQRPSAARASAACQFIENLSIVARRPHLEDGLRHPAGVVQGADAEHQRHVHVRRAAGGGRASARR